MYEDHIFKISVLILVIVYVATFFYCYTLYGILKRLPRENQQFPSWFVWLFLVPWIGLIFQWIMSPFGIPSALKKTLSTNQVAIQDANNLFKLALAQLIFTFFGIFFPMHPVNQISAVLGIIFWIVYWVMIVRFKNKYLVMSAQ
jgi:hypothetical protein